ncbi:DUF2059 domain-containing protein [Psychrobacter jeotgali]|uniref:DUF2059 domain-containing protein n=1 Tax=Psychrobacter jeotgali TaxID=179010 RepID=UPI00191A38F8|nr:DUF2059 domain-containing protein [Psychrobacter jeotgali]
MSVLSKAVLSKVSTLPLSLLGSMLGVVILMSGCEQNSSRGAEDLVITDIALEGLNDAFFTPLINSSSLSDEQKSCLEARDKNLGRAELQSFYREQFSEDEIQELEDFYTSDAGEKMLDYSNQQILIMSGEKVSRAVSAPTKEQQAQIQAFMKSPVAIKYIQLTSAEGEGSTMGALIAPMNAEFERCNIDLDMSEFV